MTRGGNGKGTFPYKTKKNKKKVMIKTVGNYNKLKQINNP